MNATEATITAAPAMVTALTGSARTAHPNATAITGFT